MLIYLENTQLKAIAFNSQSNIMELGICMQKMYFFEEKQKTVNLNLCEKLKHLLDIFIVVIPHTVE